MEREIDVDIRYIETKRKNAAFHFSVEEYMMHNYNFDKPLLMIWQTDKCVMLGCNQIAEAEIDIGFANCEKIQITRRSSGGGTIYTDLGTLLYTMIQPHSTGENSQEVAKSTIANIIVDALNCMGIPAKPEGRNDILVNGKKVSGLAQYTRNEMICTHGSLLYDTNLETLTRVLQVDGDKILSKAIRSVRSRVANLKEFIENPGSTQFFWELLKQKLFKSRELHEYKLKEHDLSEIDKIFQKKYTNPSWIFGRTPKFSFHNSKRFAGGKVEVFLDVDRGLVTSCNIRGDFLGTIPINSLEQIFENKLFQCQVFRKALSSVSIQPYLGKITCEELLTCFFE